MGINLNSLCKIQKKNLGISFDFNYQTNIIAVFVDHENSHLNNLLSIPCKDGIPISGYSYDCASDCYIKECINYFDLGSVQGCSLLRIHDTWDIKIPLCHDVCLKLLSRTQKKLLNDFIKLNSYEKLSLEFIQLIEA